MSPPSWPRCPKVCPTSLAAPAVEGCEAVAWFANLPGRREAWAGGANQPLVILLPMKHGPRSSRVRVAQLVLLGAAPYCSSVTCSPQVTGLPVSSFCCMAMP